ncbi:E3 ubiquitin-protein ligase RNF180-like [Neocloeon triangulifer]|uniref:E3 ubiquitin-protein ligase RNF180-like n=1 Tax=Neocloeon triangulifer TaxID=2078957 RepID=UPI00286ED501|nr:E3 ubiquitin-protein ligase RNF180-like [Neocloeon triangulifer]
MQEKSPNESRDSNLDHLKGCYRLHCCNCSKVLVSEAQGLITDSHGALIFKGEEQTCPDASLWYLKEGLWPSWIEEQIVESGWTKGRLCCLACKNRIGAFDFVSGAQCLCEEKVVRPAVQITRAKVDLKSVRNG